MDGFDVIGDVHGHADKLEGLLHRMGYRVDGGTWRHPSRRAVFVGDLIDRGPQQVHTVRIVQRMVADGQAQIVLGNHEFNAMAWATPDPSQPGAHLRPHDGDLGAKNRRQHAQFLDQVGDGSELHAELIEWFMTIPLWTDLGGLRVVHACWDAEAMATLRPMLSGTGSATPELVVEGSRRGSPVYEAVETILKGPEIDLPAGFSYLDKDGHERHRARFSWWDGEATTLRRGAEIPAGVTAVDGRPLPELPDTPLGDRALPRYNDPVPVIYGHYWRTGTPHVVNANAACVDYSAGKGGPLVAYRWSGEPELNDDGFVAFP